MQWLDRWYAGERSVSLVKEIWEGEVKEKTLLKRATRLSSRLKRIRTSDKFDEGKTLFRFKQEEDGEAIVLNPEDAPGIVLYKITVKPPEKYSVWSQAIGREVVTASTGDGGYKKVVEFFCPGYFDKLKENKEKRVAKKPRKKSVSPKAADKTPVEVATLTTLAPEPEVSVSSHEAESTGPKYPHITVKLSGVVDGNAFAILGAICSVMARKGVSAEERAIFKKEAMSGDYNHLLATAMCWVTVN
jgi:hypothetical protein